MPGSPACGGGTPARRGFSAAVTDPPLAALPGVPELYSQGQPPPGEPPRPPAGAALIGLPLAAQTGRAASRAPRRWRHTTVPPGGRMGEARRSVCWNALPSPRGARTWRAHSQWKPTQEALI